MKPDFKIKHVKLYNVDCMDFMKEIPDNYYELAIVDPPYGIGAGKMTMGKGSRNDTGKNEKKDWDLAVPNKEYFDELLRISKHQIIWGGNYYIDYLYSTRCFLLWDKLDYNSDFASHELAWTSFNKNTKCFRRARNKGTTIKIHPTQKPAELYKWILTKYAKPTDKIFDSHGGSFSSACACLDMGFEFDGCEIDKEYFDNAVERLKNNVQEYLDF